VEFALVLPILITVMWLGVESVLLVRDQTLVTHAAREAARAAAVGATADEAADVAGSRSGFGASGVFRVSLSLDGDVVEATARLRERARLPLLGRLVPSLEVTAVVGMRVEEAG
jgi:hypothetical protein